MVKINSTSGLADMHFFIFFTTNNR